MSLFEILREVREPIVEKVEDQVAKMRLNFLQKSVEKWLEERSGMIPGLKAVAQGRMFKDYIPGITKETVEAYTTNNPSHDVSAILGSYTDNAISYAARVDSDFKSIVEADPSQQKKYLGWIIRWWFGMAKMENGYNQRREDLYKIREYLGVLNRGLVRGFDINSVKTLPELYRAVAPYLEGGSKRQVSAQERAVIDSETVVRYKGPEGMIVIPKTERAAQFWGRGTQWCTGARENCMFKHYAERGDLFVIVLPDGTKYQLHLSSGQFMDEQDAPVDPGTFLKEYPWVRGALNLTADDVERDQRRDVGASNLDPSMYAFLPDPIPDEMSRRLIAYSPKNVVNIPNVSDELVDHALELALYADKVRSSHRREDDPYDDLEQAFGRGSDLPSILTWMSNNNRPMDEKLIKAILDFEPEMLLHIHHPTPGMIWAAIKDDPKILDKVSVKLITPEMFEYAIKRYPKMFERVPRGRDMELMYRLAGVALETIIKKPPTKRIYDWTDVFTHVGIHHWRDCIRYLVKRGFQLDQFPESWRSFLDDVVQGKQDPIKPPA